jgi:hypothetical protein
VSTASGRGGGRWAWVATLVLALGVATSAAGGALPDRDGDGLPDEWETHGVTVGGRFIDLPAMGADPDRPDVFLQVDAMVDATHDQRPDPAAIARVVDAFARAPYTSPTGSVGIRLHVDAGPESIMSDDGRRWGALSHARVLPWQDDLGTAASGTYDWRGFLAIRDEPGGFSETGRGPVFHYAIFGFFHDRDDPGGSGASGISRGIGGTEFLVTLGNFTDGHGSVSEQAGTLMHELGHNFGLRHGGDDDTNSKPGYVSVMNYAFQMDGLVRGGVRGIVDFSRGAEASLDEALDDPPAVTIGGPDGPVDEACVGERDERAGSAVRPVAGSAGGAGDTFDDWAHVRLAVGAIGRLPAKTAAKTPMRRPAARAVSRSR